ncbi:MAG: phytanoyl-CoA dioxygenase family protein, partial [bacterium]|nr:phytanoyl-CoA dioxygenase family protein [bacterium]
SLRGTNLLDIEKPHCDIFRRMLVHPAIVSRLNIMCGKGFRLDHGPQFIGGVKGTSGHALHGSGAPHKPYVAYHHQNGNMHCAGVTVSWQLADVPEGKGGFACVPGSHKSDFEVPEGVWTVDSDMGASINPGARAGDVVFFMDGAQTHGTYPWQNDHERRSILYKFASRTAIRTGISVQIAPPEIYWDEEIVDGMTNEQRAVMYGPCSGHGGLVPSLDITEAGEVVVEAQAESVTAIDGLRKRSA